MTAVIHRTNGGQKFFLLTKNKMSMTSDKAEWVINCVVSFFGHSTLTPKHAITIDLTRR